MSNYEGKSFKIKETSTHKQFPNFGGSIIRIEGYWSEVHGKSWTEGFNEGNPAAIIYSLRMKDNNLPMDDDVLYGHTDDGLGHLVHVSELKEELQE